jgi:hypothetical protein
MDEKEFFEFYRNRFLKPYSDFIALAQYKPEQVLIEESNILSHLAQFFNYDLSEEIRNENLIKAKNHLIRITLDLNKLVWHHLYKNLYSLIIKDEQKRLCFNSPVEEVLKKYGKFLKEGMEARNHEMANVGNHPDDSIKHYEQVNEQGFKILDDLDQVKLESHNSWKRIIRTKEFLLGIAISLSAALIIWILSLIF